MSAPQRRKLGAIDLAAAWEEHANEWVRWARAEGHDSYWWFHRDQFLELVPPAGRATLDLGCGEGRLSRHLKQAGHHVKGVDASPTLVAAASEADPEIEVELADAAKLPFTDAEFDCVVAFMSLQDVKNLEQALAESARVLEDGGTICIAIVHPLVSAGAFRGQEPDAPFVIEGSYVGPSFYVDEVNRAGFEMTFASAHRPLEAYADAITRAGLLIDRIREPTLPDAVVRHERQRQWQRVPNFLHLRAHKPRNGRWGSG